MNPEQWLSLKWNGGSTMSDRWLNQSKIIHLISFGLIPTLEIVNVIAIINAINLFIFFSSFISIDLNYINVRIS